MTVTLTLRIASHQPFQQPIGFQSAIVDRLSCQIQALCNSPVCHIQESVHQKNFPVFLGQFIEGIGKEIIFDQDQIFASYDRAVFPGAAIINRKLLHCFVRQLAERDFTLLLVAVFSIAVVGCAFQHFLAKAVEGVLLMFFVDE